ncbi:MAG: ATP-binding cassette domain-containing protein [Acidimicrobiia bacterium]
MTKNGLEANPPSPPVVVEQATKSFGGDVAVQDLTLTVERATIMGVIGPSGCGKTTFMRMLTGVAPASDGSVRVLGRDPASFTADDRGRIGYMPQIPVLFPQLSMWANLNFVASVYGLSHRGRRRRLMDLLRFVELEPHRHKKLREASGGMQRRLTLAATLVHQPELILLDEPTAGIDPILRDRFWERFRALRDAGHTLVVSTQYVGEAAMCDLVAVMEGGRLIALDAPDALRRRAFGGDVLRIDVAGGSFGAAELLGLRALPGVVSVHRNDETLTVVADDSAAALPAIAEYFRTASIEAGPIEVVTPSYDEVFVKLIAAERAAASAGERASDSAGDRVADAPGVAR